MGEVYIYGFEGEKKVLHETFQFLELIETKTKRNRTHATALFQGGATEQSIKKGRKEERKTENGKKIKKIAIGSGGRGGGGGGGGGGGAGAGGGQSSERSKESLSTALEIIIT